MNMRHMEWKKKDEDLLREMYSLNIGLKTIARKLGRTVEACYTRAYKIGLHRNNKKQKSYNIDMEKLGKSRKIIYVERPADERTYIVVCPCGLQHRIRV